MNNTGFADARYPLPIGAQPKRSVAVAEGSAAGLTLDTAERQILDGLGILAGVSDGEATRLAYGTEEAKEGRAAFLEKRKRDFSKFPWSY